MYFLLFLGSVDSPKQCSLYCASKHTWAEELERIYIIYFLGKTLNFDFVLQIKLHYFEFIA